MRKVRRYLFAALPISLLSGVIYLGRHLTDRFGSIRPAAIINPLDVGKNSPLTSLGNLESDICAFPLFRLAKRRELLMNLDQKLKLVRSVQNIN